ncbi:Uncharacterised protein [Serratia grimesii]|jgi:hypothetical protein|nr:Uncharacterised protein [Serratia grimesii]
MNFSFIWEIGLQHWLSFPLVTGHAGGSKHNICWLSASFWALSTEYL